MSDITREQPLTAEELSARDLEFYSAVVSGWIETRMERDRSVLTLSAGGIGLLVTILTTVGVPIRWLLWLYAAAGLCFLIACTVCVYVFGTNAEHLEQIASNKAGISRRLKNFDRASLGSLVLGVVITLAIGVITALQNPQPTVQKETNSVTSDSGRKGVSSDPKPETKPSSRPNVEGTETKPSSRPDLQNKGPSSRPGVETHSLSGIENLRPERPGSAPDSGAGQQGGGPPVIPDSTNTTKP